jgi:REP element-mobilizing transposase RayT
MSRGDRGEAIFRCAPDREMFLAAVEEACERTGWRVHAYVLMDNHYHLLLETPEPNLVVGMQWLQSTYTKRFNARHRLWGHVFQGRYKAIPVEPEGEYFSTVADYIHLNPEVHPIG